MQSETQPSTQIDRFLATLLEISMEELEQLKQNDYHYYELLKIGAKCKMLELSESDLIAISALKKLSSSQK